MSAPVEVWVESLGGYLEARSVQLSVAAVRYLRADLTCGECAHRKDWRYCPKYRDCNEGGYDQYCEENEPACMAFTPKAVKP